MIINENLHDVAIIGAGVGGALAAYKLSKDQPEAKVIVFDFGRPFGKRRRQLEGWLGCLPNSDGKFYLNDSDDLNLTKTKINSSEKYLTKLLSQVMDVKEELNSPLSKSMMTKLSKNNYNVHGISANGSKFIQMIPKEIHLLSKYMVKDFDKSNLSFVFDNEVVSIDKQSDHFTISTEYHIFKAKKIIFGVGRSGWRFANKIFNHFGLIKENNTAKFGVKIEMPEKNMPKGFNKSSCFLSKQKKEWEDNYNLSSIDIGRFNWNGQVIPEDHYDLIITGFRSNENRWKTDNVSFDVIGNMKFENNGFEQTDRIGKLSMILANDRALKEKISSLFAKKSKISVMKEYDWLIPVITDLSEIIPDMENGANIHLPTLITSPGKINVSKKLETDLKDFYCIGESAGYSGLLNAAVTGLAAADYVME